ncbi:MAG: HAD-IA family hydrolase [Clostridia bacterium]|nr:HAD-IA family hydrolase [Clostridia bacterium]
MSELKALIFDCDGVLAETERDGHRVAFNAAFKALGLETEWDDKTYGELVLVSGGKERMKRYFSAHPEQVPAGVSLDELIVQLHVEKTRLFAEMSAGGALPVRAGINRLIDEAHAAGVKLAVCTTSNIKSVTALMNAILGPERTAWFDQILAGDIVKVKKPAPDIYLMASELLEVPAENCFVVEDTNNGLTAAKAAGMACLVTLSHYSAEEDISMSDLAVNTLGDPGLEPIEIVKPHPAVSADTAYITLNELRNMLA